MRKKPITNLPSDERKYIELSEIYLAKYEDQEQRHLKMMMAKGILVEMESDLVFFHMKNEKTEKSEHQQNRLDLLKSAIDEFSAIHAFNFQVKMVLSKFYAENNALKAENEKLKKQIESHLEALNNDI